MSNTFAVSVYIYMHIYITHIYVCVCVCVCVCVLYKEIVFWSMFVQYSTLKFVIFINNFWIMHAWIIHKDAFFLTVLQFYVHRWQLMLLLI